MKRTKKRKENTRKITPDVTTNLDLHSGEFTNIFWKKVAAASLTGFVIYVTIVLITGLTIADKDGNFVESGQIVFLIMLPIYLLYAIITAEVYYNEYMNKFKRLYPSKKYLFNTQTHKEKSIKTTALMIIPYYAGTLPGILVLTITLEGLKDFLIVLGSTAIIAGVMFTIITAYFKINKKWAEKKLGKEKVK